MNNSTSTRTSSDEVDVNTVTGDRVATISWSNPAERNAMTTVIADGLAAHLETADADPDVAVIVIAGQGNDFSVGGSISYLNSLSSSISTQGVPNDIRRGAMNPQPVEQLLSTRKPIIAAISGACAGIGFIIAAASDIRFAANTAIFTSAFTRRGLPAEQGIAWLLPRIVGGGTARELLISSRRFDALEARTLRFVTNVFEADTLMTEVNAYAVEIANNCSPTAMSRVKTQLGHDDCATVAESRQFAENLVYETIAESDFREGVASFVERRPPNFGPVQPVR